MTTEFEKKNSFSSSTVVLLIVVILLIASVASLGIRNESLRSTDQNLLARYNSLNNNYSYASNQLNQSNHEYNELLSNYTQTRIIYQNPSSNKSIGIWYGYNVTVPAGAGEEWQLLDTFVNHVDITSNQSVNFVIFSLNNFFYFFAGKPYVTFYNATGLKISYDVHITQGCANYVLVVFNHLNTTARLTPDVTATYAPTPFLTGDCAIG